MSKYKSKQQLLDEISKESVILDNLISELDEKSAAAGGVCETWSAKDVINHLAEWQKMVLDWYSEGSKGNIPEVPGKGYKWSDLPKLNNDIYEKYKNLTLSQSLDFFDKTKRQISNLIDTTDEQILLKPGLQSWMNKNTLIAYLGSCTASHYKWASGLIKKYIRSNCII